jgi:hypothetical protein
MTAACISLVAAMVLLYGCIGIEQTEEEIMESNAQAIASKLDFSIEEARGIVNIFNEVGIGKIRTITIDDRSDEWNYFFTLTDDKRASFYVATEGVTGISSIKKDNKDGEMIYHGPVDSPSEESIEYMREEIKKIDIKESNMYAIANRLEVSAEEAKEAAELFSKLGIGKMESMSPHDGGDEPKYSFTLTDSNKASYYVVMEAPAHIVLVAKDTIDGEVIYHD